MQLANNRIAWSSLAALLVTAISVFVTEGVLASLGSNGAGTATVMGFPLPFITFFGCCFSFGPPPVTLDNTYFFHPLSFVADYALWLAPSYVIISTFSLKKLLLASVGGLGVTISTLILSPLSLVAPTASDEAIISPMGFPYEYLTRYVIEFPLGLASSGYEFSLGPALADFSLWFGIVFSLLAITSIISIKIHKSSPPIGNNESNPISSPNRS
jgi:hypothetical protein